jgi:hypothetical protein
VCDDLTTVANRQTKLPRLPDDRHTQLRVALATSRLYEHAETYMNIQFPILAPLAVATHCCEHRSSSRDASELQLKIAMWLRQQVVLT